MSGRTRDQSGAIREEKSLQPGGSEQALSHHLAERTDEGSHCMRVNGDGT